MLYLDKVFCFNVTSKANFSKKSSVACTSASKKLSRPKEMTLPFVVSRRISRQSTATVNRLDKCARGVPPSNNRNLFDRAPGLPPSWAET